ncbi:MAG: TrmH family RNA methyltransferase [Patescibacteria group bacterium]
MLIVIAHNIRSLHNVGSIFRTSEGAGVSKVYLTGYTGFPPRREIAKVALGSENRIPWEYRRNISYVIKKLKLEGYQIVVCEQDSRSIDFKNLVPNKKIALLMGNEVRGVSKSLRDQADQLIHIPMLGSRKSFNVSVAFGIVAYDIGKKICSLY